MYILWLKTTHLERYFIATCIRLKYMTTENGELLKYHNQGFYEHPY